MTCPVLTMLETLSMPIIAIYKINNEHDFYITIVCSKVNFPHFRLEKGTT